MLTVLSGLMSLSFVVVLSGGRLSDVRNLLWKSLLSIVVGCLRFLQPSMYISKGLIKQ